MNNLKAAAIILCICSAGCTHTTKISPMSTARSNAAAVSIVFPVPVEPAIHGPRIVGATPGKPFLFLIPATGEGPLTFEAENLPEGLALNPAMGIIHGTLKGSGETSALLGVSGPKGTAARKLTIVGGRHKLALTPPMGWNSWNVWAGSVDAAKVRAAADWLVKSGLAAHGYQYINIDDTWEAKRDATGEIVPNEKFPDMKALADYVHSKGLKLGIYSSPGPTTCAGYEGSYRHEAQDVNTYAKWGIDYLKYDLCGYRDIMKDPSRQQRIYPYLLMGL
ncbi:MAG TPA: glycoside hydrolase family 27 protein, partial [Methylococcales bacterium]